MSTGPKAACLECARLRFGRKVWGWVCDAFPDGVPEEIYAGGNPHTSPVPGDHGILFVEGTNDLHK